eukprot:scaffold706788_cov63-Attheya_sp.AAC.1
MSKRSSSSGSSVDETSMLPLAASKLPAQQQMIRSRSSGRKVKQRVFHDDFDEGEQHLSRASSVHSRSSISSSSCSSDGSCGDKKQESSTIMGSSNVTKAKEPANEVGPTTTHKTLQEPFIVDLTGGPNITEDNTPQSLKPLDAASNPSPSMKSVSATVSHANISPQNPAPNGVQGSTSTVQATTSVPQNSNSPALPTTAPTSVI